MLLSALPLFVIILVFSKMAFDLRFNVLDYAMRHAATFGWTDLALVMGAADVGLPAISARAF
jgi:hypothetical protein